MFPLYFRIPLRNTGDKAFAKRTATAHCERNNMKKYILAFSLLVIAAITVAISFFTLFSQSIRLDESQSIWVATKPVISILYLDAQDVLVPLYSIILHFWLQIFGTSVVAARIL